jgi:hypothetical protein
LYIANKAIRPGNQLWAFEKVSAPMHNGPDGVTFIIKTQYRIIPNGIQLQGNRRKVAKGMDF